MNAFPVLNFVHDADKFFAYHFCVSPFCIIFLNFIYIASC